MREGLRSVAFPLISAGIFGYPPEPALTCAVGAIRAFLAIHADMEVSLVLFDEEDARAGALLFPDLMRTAEPESTGPSHG